MSDADRGSSTVRPALDARRRAMLEDSRRAILVTIGPSGAPRPVPVCFALAPTPVDVLWTPIDEKPKQEADPLRLARVRDIIERPAVALLVDRWDEDWSRLAWLRLEGKARLLAGPPAPVLAAPSAPANTAASTAAARARQESEPAAEDAAEHAAAVASLRARYPQYAAQRLEERPIIRVAITRVVAWGPTDADGHPPRRTHRR